MTKGSKRSQMKILLKLMSKDLMLSKKFARRMKDLPVLNLMKMMQLIKVRTREAMGIINKKEKRQTPSLSLLKKVWCRIKLNMRWLTWMMGRW